MIIKNKKKAFCIAISENSRAKNKHIITDDIIDLS
jgi:hypothetical protein